MDNISKSDWKNYKEIREKALDTFCKNALKTLKSGLDASDQSAQEIYLAHYRRLQEINKEMTFLFDGGVSRSKADLNMMALRSRKLVDDADLERLSEGFIRVSQPNMR